MCKKAKTTKFKVINAKINKKLVGEELDLQKIKSKSGHGDGGNKPGSTNKITLSKLSDKVDNLSDNLSKLAKIVADGFANVNHRIDNLVKVNNLKE